MHATVTPGVRSLVRLCLLIGCGVWGCSVWLCGTAFSQTSALTNSQAPTLTTSQINAQKLFLQAQKAERNGELLNAYLWYAQAAGADPQNLTYWQHVESLRPAVSLLNPSPPKPPDVFQPTDHTLFGTISEQDLNEARRPLPPVLLKAAAGRQDYDLTGDSKELWEQLAAALHLMVLFDTQYQPTRPVRFQVADVDYRDALRELEAATNSFLVPVSERLIFVANDTPVKRTEFERTVAVVIPFTETVDVKELQEIATGVRGTLDMQKVMVDTQRHLILMRDRVTKVRLAQMLLEDLMRPRAQVAVEVEILDTDRSSALNYGLSLQSAFPLINLPIKSYLQNVIPSGYTSFLTFGAGSSLLALGVTTAELFANVSKSDTRTLIQSELVALDGQPSSMHIGERYPVMTSGYFGSGGSPATTGTTPVITNSGTPVVNQGATGAGTLQLSQTSISWIFASGGAAPTDTSVSVTSTSGTINYTATVISSSPWLVVNNLATTSGTLPATLTISPGANLTSLGTGSYQGTIQLSGSDGSVAYITVSLAVNGGAQNLVLSPDTITLTASPGGLEVQQTVSVSSGIGGAVTATVTGTGLSAAASDTSVATNTPFTVTVLGNPAGLSAQDYQGVLSVTVAGVTEEIPVAFDVVASGSLQLSQSSIPWTYSTGGTLPESVNVTISSSTNSPSFTATASSANSWLLVDGQTTLTGSLPAVLTISPSTNLAQLSTGTYTGTVQLSAADGSLAYLNVNLTVNGGTATGLTVSPSPITFNLSLGGVAQQQTVTVTSMNAGTLTATVSGSGLSVLALPTTTVAANTPVSFTLDASPTGLTAQNYVGYLTVTVAGVTQTIQVTLSVGAISSGGNGTGVYTPPPTFNFEDLGLVLKVTPHIHGMDEVTLDIDAEFKLLTGSVNDGIPIIENRKYESKVSVRTGEWAVLAGLITSSESRSITGIPVISSIPLLGNKMVSRDDGRTLIVLKPHIIIAPPTEEPTWRAWAGTETRLPAPF